MKIEYTPEQLKFFKRKASKGGKTTKERHGTKHYSEMAKKRWDKVKKLSTANA